MHGQADIEILIDAESLRNRISELGAEIARDYKDKKLTILVVLKGSFVFAADLIRAIQLPMNVEFIGLKSYGSRQETSGVVQITMDLKHPLLGQDLLIVEDIVDTGLTISYLMENLATRKPNSMKLASLLHKPSRSEKEVVIDYLGFTVPDRFVLGYGLDDNGLMRNLPYIGAYK